MDVLLQLVVLSEDILILFVDSLIDTVLGFLSQVFQSLDLPQLELDHPLVVVLSFLCHFQLLFQLVDLFGQNSVLGLSNEGSFAGLFLLLDEGIVLESEGGDQELVVADDLGAFE